MKYARIAKIAKQAIDNRGGVEALKQDMHEVADAAKGKGSLKEKAKAAAEALRQPSSATEGETPAAPAAAAAAPPAAAAPAAENPGAPPHESTVAPAEGEPQP